MSRLCYNTDEHKSYKTLEKLNFVHNGVCHKYNFVNPVNGVHTQSVESFNNSVKLEIKRRKGVRHYHRESFLKEFCWKFNNKNSRLEKILEILKI